VTYQGLNNQTGHPIIKAIINPLVNWIWIGVLVIVFGTGMALVPNATLISVPVARAIAISSVEKQGMQPAGMGK
jgi:cytochrome c-type biogenesis protein CcmF